jgi:hypothetical protein
MELTPLHKTILVTCSDGDVGLWAVIWKINGGPYARDEVLPDETRRNTIRILHDLLDEGLIFPGFPKMQKNGKAVFEPMPGAPSEIIAYIEKDWDDLGGAPNIGDTIWFQVTPTGAQLANEIVASVYDQ